MRLHYYETRETVVELTEQEEQAIRNYAAKHDISLLVAADDLHKMGELNAYNRSTDIDHTIDVVELFAGV